MKFILLLQSAETYTLGCFKQYLLDLIAKIRLPWMTWFIDTGEYLVHGDKRTTYLPLAELLNLLEEGTSVRASSSSASSTVDGHRTASASSSTSSSVSPRIEAKPIAESLQVESGLDILERLIPCLLKQLFETDLAEALKAALRQLLAYAYLIKAFQQLTPNKQREWLDSQERLSDLSVLEQLNMTFAHRDFMYIYAAMLSRINLGDYYWIISGTCYQMSIVDRAIISNNIELAIFLKAMGVEPTLKTTQNRIYSIDQYDSMPLDNVRDIPSWLSTFEKDGKITPQKKINYDAIILFTLIRDVRLISWDIIANNSNDILSKEINTLKQKLNSRINLGIWIFFRAAFLNPLLLHVLTYAARQPGLEIKAIDYFPVVSQFVKYAVKNVHVFNAYDLISAFKWQNPLVDRITVNVPGSARGESCSALNYVLRRSDLNPDVRRRLIFALLPAQLDASSFNEKWLIMRDYGHIPYREALLLLILCGAANFFEHESHVFQEAPSLTTAYQALIAFRSQCLAQETLEAKALRVVYRHYGFKGVPDEPRLAHYQQYGENNPLIVSVAGFWSQLRTYSPEAKSCDNGPILTFLTNRRNDEFFSSICEEADSKLNNYSYHYVKLLMEFCVNPLNKLDNLSAFIGWLGRFDLNFLKTFVEKDREKFFKQTFNELRRRYVIPKSSIPRACLILLFEISSDESTQDKNHMLQHALERTEDDISNIYTEWLAFVGCPISLPQALDTYIGDAQKLTHPTHPWYPLLRTLLFLETYKHPEEEVQYQQLIGVYTRLLRDISHRPAASREIEPITGPIFSSC